MLLGGAAETTVLLVCTWTLRPHREEQKVHVREVVFSVHTPMLCPSSSSKKMGHSHTPLMKH